MEIANYKQINKGCLQAIFDVTIEEWGLEIRNFTLFEKDGRKWLGMPSKKYLDRDGSEKYLDIIRFNQTAKEKFEKACIDKINKGDFKQYQDNKSNNQIPF